MDMRVLRCEDALLKFWNGTSGAEQFGIPLITMLERHGRLVSCWSDVPAARRINHVHEAKVVCRRGVSYLGQRLWR